MLIIWYAIGYVAGGVLVTLFQDQILSFFDKIYDFFHKS